MGHGNSAVMDPVSGSVRFPDVRFLPAGAGRHRDVVAIQPDESGGLWRTTSQMWLTGDEVAGGQRLVPVGPLLDLAAAWEAEADGARARAADLEGSPSAQLWGVKAAVLGRCARELREAAGVVGEVGSDGVG